MKGSQGVRRVCGGLLAVVLAAAPGAAPGNGEGAECDPRVRGALERSAVYGVERDFAIIRDPGQGIRDPESIFDFSCLENLFNYRLFNVFFDPGRAMEEILGLAKREVCKIAQQAYRDAVGRKLDAAVYTRGLPRLPGLEIDPVSGNVIRGAENDEGVLRGIFGE